MQDTALYQYLLGLKSPWTVSRVHLNVKEHCVDVWGEHPKDAAWECPHCTKTLPLYDHAEERTWGGTWTAASSRPTCTRVFHGWNAWNTVWCRSRFRGQSRGRGSRCVRGPRHRRAEPMRCKQGHEDLADQLG